MMQLLIFILTLSALVLVHELGHFLVAKFFGMRVEEFGIGLPPRMKKLFVSGGTVFSLNWLPIGGFVKLFGEDMEFEYLRSTSFVFTKYDLNAAKDGIIGVIGPARMNFPLVLPYVKYVRDLLVEAGRS